MNIDLGMGGAYMAHNFRDCLIEKMAKKGENQSPKPGSINEIKK